jgi:hypothetical protein
MRFLGVFGFHGRGVKLVVVLWSYPEIPEGWVWEFSVMGDSATGWLVFRSVLKVFIIEF